MAEQSYTGTTYRLRAGSPIYDESGRAYLHTFGGEKNTILIYECTTPNRLPSSDDFMGQGGNLMSASFSKIGDRNHHYQGRIVYQPVFVEENAVTSAYENNLRQQSNAGSEITFIECTSINISYDIMGLVTVSYTVVSNTPGMKVFYVVSSGPGGTSYGGFVTNASYNPLANTSWYETHVTLMAVTSGGTSSRVLFAGDNSPKPGAGEAPLPTWWYNYKK